MTVDLSSLGPALEFAVGGAVVSTLVGGGLGMVAGTRDMAVRRSALALSAALLAAPPAFWWIGLTRLPFNAGTFQGPAWGALVAGIALAPVTLLLVLAATREIPAQAYEAARISLAPLRRVRHVLLPMVSPALLAGFLLTAILLLGESEIPFLFAFRTSMTDVVTTFAQTYDVARTLPAVLPLVAAVLLLALVLMTPLFDVILAAPAPNRGVDRKAAGGVAALAMWLLPAVVLLASAGYVRAAFFSGGDAWRRAWSVWPAVGISIAEPVVGALIAVGGATLVVYPLRRSGAAKALAIGGLLLFSIPTAVVAIAWIAIGQALNGVSAPPLAAHVSRLAGLGVLGFVVAYGRLPRSMEAAADLVSMSHVRRAWTLILPLVATSLAASAALVAALTFADRDVASLLLAPGDSRLMLHLYLVSANAPAALVGATALIVLAAGAAAIGVAAAVPKVVFSRTRG